ncbi:unnamed protein product [Spirodela intermedia]|uniref:Uncharacterized protein n=1 Tax=Spirodela intermedia TaxID=51605 RepID=A0A7I8JIS3_SPIIN|nr:unnamed protein product [Spirodela intermedia]CAA6670068.1 unnamed protein product [Spirodela intermedia]
MGTNAAKFIKCVTVGDARGKTCMLICYNRNKFPTVRLRPHVFDNFSANVVAEALELQGADVFVLAFSLVSRASYENVTKKRSYSRWIPELQHFARGVPVVCWHKMVNLREDRHYLSDHPGWFLLRQLRYEICMGEELRKQIGAAYYIECSSKTQQVVVNPPSKRKREEKGATWMLIIVSDYAQCFGFLLFYCIRYIFIYNSIFFFWSCGLHCFLFVDSCINAKLHLSSSL